MMCERNRRETHEKIDYVRQHLTVNILLLDVLSAYLTLWDLMRKTEMRLGEEEERRVSGSGDGTSGVTKCESVWECLLNPLFFYIILSRWLLLL